MDDRPDSQRRAVLGLMAGAPLLPALLAAPLAVQAAVPTDRVTVLYRRESPQAPSRLEPVVQAATLALEREFRKEQFRVLQPTAEIYQLLDQGQGVVITFATDAGFSLVFSAYADLRPMAGQDSGMAEVRLATRVFVGRHILFADEGRGQMVTRLEPATREFGIRRALEAAARRAAADVAEKAVGELRALTPQRINEMVGANATSTTTAQAVQVPAAAPSGGSVVAPPPLPTGGGTAPAPASVAPAGPAAPPLLAPSAGPPPAAPAPASADATLPAPRNRYAVVVGMSNYSAVREANKGWDIGDLDGVAKDVNFVVESLGKLGYSNDRMKVLRDREATGGAVRGAIKDLAGKVQADDAVLVFIAGHGADKDESTSGYGMPVLADHKSRDPNSLDFWELQSFIKNLKGRVVWINDTCHSGGAVNNIASVVLSSSGVTSQMGVKGPNALTVAGNAAAGQDFAILTACAPSEVSLEDGGGGLFTTALFKELVRTGGQVPLAQVFANTVARQVIDRSIKMCRSGNLCASHSQQTPMMAYSGKGAQFRV